MGHCVHYKDGKFAIWSSITDSYITKIMTSNECMRYLLDLSDHVTAYQRLTRAKENGCSLIPEQIRCEDISFDDIRDMGTDKVKQMIVDRFEPAILEVEEAFDVLNIFLCGEIYPFCSVKCDELEILRIKIDNLKGLIPTVQE
jgi:hypothetical protein